jgi:hypothetical protein
LEREGAAYVFVKPAASSWVSTIQIAKLILVEAVAGAARFEARLATTTIAFDFSRRRVAVLGAGKMGGILLKALLEKGLLSPQSTVSQRRSSVLPGNLPDLLVALTGPEAMNG